ncbi:MAG: rhombosortase [bacterium]
MEFKTRRDIIVKIPNWTLAVFIISIVTYAIPSLRHLLIYDRDAIIAGQLWRLLTSHFVHFSIAHLFYNLLVFCIAGSLIENRGYRSFGTLCFLTAFFISITLFIAKPDMSYYGGLSGIACGAVVYLILFEFLDSSLWTAFFCIVILLSIIVKLVIEALTGQFIFVASNTLFVPIPLSHITGSLVALIFFCIGLISVPSQSKISKEMICRE